MNNNGIPWNDGVDATKLDQPEHEWLRVIAEVYGAGQPRPRPRTLEGGCMNFPATEPGPYEHLDSRELWILASWHLKELYTLWGQMDVGEQFDGSDRRDLQWHNAVLCAIHAALGEEFEERLGGLISRLSEHTDSWVAKALTGQESIADA